MERNRKYNGKVLGVLGGMGPAATAEFMRLIVEKTPANIDQEHPKLIVYSNPQIPNRTDFLVGKGQDPSPSLKDGLYKLLSWGADILAVPCNTSHYYIKTFPQDINSRLISIIDETIELGRSVSARGAWLTATLGTMDMGIYQQRASELDYNFEIPRKEIQLKIHQVTDLVKKGHYQIAGNLFKEICEELVRIKDLPITCACTELPLAYQYAGLPLENEISSLEALAFGCVRELFK